MHTVLLLHTAPPPYTPCCQVSSWPDKIRQGLVSKLGLKDEAGVWSALPRIYVTGDYIGDDMYPRLYKVGGAGGGAWGTTCTPDYTRWGVRGDWAWGTTCTPDYTRWGVRGGGPGHGGGDLCGTAARWGGPVWDSGTVGGTCVGTVGGTCVGQRHGGSFLSGTVAVTSVGQWRWPVWYMDCGLCGTLRGTCTLDIPILNCHASVSASASASASPAAAAVSAAHQHHFFWDVHVLMYSFQFSGATPSLPLALFCSIRLDTRTHTP